MDKLLVPPAPYNLLRSAGVTRGYYTVNTNVQRSLNSNQRSAEFPPSNTRYYSVPLSTHHIFSEIDNFIFDNVQNYCELKNDFTDVEGSFARNKIQLENLSKSLEYRYLSALCPSIALHHPVLYQHKHQVNVKRLFLPWLVSPLQLLSRPGLTVTNNHFTALIFYIVTKCLYHRLTNGLTALIST